MTDLKQNSPPVPFMKTPFGFSVRLMRRPISGAALADETCLSRRRTAVRFQQFVDLDFAMVDRLLVGPGDLTHERQPPPRSGQDCPPPRIEP